MNSKRIISCFLLIAIIFTSFVFVFPVRSNAAIDFDSYEPNLPTGKDLIYDLESVDAMNLWIDNNALITEFKGVHVKTYFWNIIDSAMKAAGFGSCLHLLDVASGACGDVNRALSRDEDYFARVGFIFETGQLNLPRVVCEFDSRFGVYRLREVVTGVWLTNSTGYFPYYRPEDTESDLVETPVIRTGQWLQKSQFVGVYSGNWHVVTEHELSVFKAQWSDVYSNMRIASGGNGITWLVRTDRNTSAEYVLCDEYGFPYIVPIEKETAVTTPQDYYTDITNQYTDNSTNVNVMDGGNAVVGSPIDVNNGIINVGGQLQYIDQLIYDASTQTYYVDAHDEYVYDLTLNQYVTNNYTYEIQYHIDHTSITYIGQTEEYDERYEMYFQLPDGRSSADLTAEDLEQLSTVFVDVVQYARSADDLSLRGLYHFDGNTEDSSYWSYCTAFDWASGASLTYMDEGTFNGSLYLDETEHDFTITLPAASDLYADFTVQFRYYQSHTTAPVADSYIQFGSDVVFQFTGSQYLLGSGDALCDTSIGCWNEICIMKNSGTIYYYINGVCCGEVADNATHANTIAFYFGDQQQTYKKIDELRISKGAIYTAGDNYTPTSVPYDTNLTLILPDGEVPVADEVMVFTPGQNNIFDQYGFSDWTDESVLDNLKLGYGCGYTNYCAGIDAFGLYYRSNYTTFTHTDLSTNINVSSLNSTYLEASVRTSSGTTYRDIYALESGLFLPLRLVYGRSSSGYSSITTFPYVQRSFLDPGSYTLSVVTADGSSSSISFTINTDGVPVVDSLINSSAVNLSLVYPYAYSLYSSNTSYYYAYRFYGISVLPNSTDVSAEIMYMELVEGTEPEFSVTYEQAVYSSGELKESPVLAVRTNRPISGYQIGGVRPSYPQRGLVYAMVENSRITSLQQYTGYAWEQVDGRIWTGERWVPYGSFDVFTLKDYHDIIGGTDPDYEYIYTETGFWSWWQRQWNQFTSTLFELLEKIYNAITGGIGDINISIENNTLLDDDDKIPFDGESYKGIIKTIRRSLDFLFGFFDSASGGLNDFLDQFDDTNSVFYGLFNLSGLGG